MDQLMYVITFVALTLAIGMSVVAARLLRGNHQRSVARVAALEYAAMADADVVDDADEMDAYRRAPDIEITHDDVRAESAAMFTAANEPHAPNRRWVALATAAIVMALLIGGGYLLLKPAALDASATVAAAPTSTTPTRARTSPTAAPLELLSLKHVNDAGTFTITGLVQDPADGEPLSHVTAVVYLFDGDGAYFATGRAALEFTGLRPGEESPFLVKIPTTARVARYRVGFRRDDGSVIAHVDRRGQAPSGMTTEGK